MHGVGTYICTCRKDMIFVRTGRPKQNWMLNQGSGGQFHARITMTAKCQSAAAASFEIAMISASFRDHRRPTSLAARTSINETCYLETRVWMRLWENSEGDGFVLELQPTRAAIKERTNTLHGISEFRREVKRLMSRDGDTKQWYRIKNHSHYSVLLLLILFLCFWPPPSPHSGVAVWNVRCLRNDNNDFFLRRSLPRKKPTSSLSAHGNSGKTPLRAGRCNV